MATSSTGTTTYTKYIKLSNFFGTQSSTNSVYNSVTFFLTPEISESRTVSYIEIGDIRLPASILIYMGSPSRNFNINAKFLARSQAEADVSFRNKSLLESWCITSGQGTQANINSALSTVNNAAGLNQTDLTSPSDTPAAVQQDGQLPFVTLPNGLTKTTASTTPITQTTDLFAQSPPVLALQGYGGQFRSIPVVIRSLNISYPSDVDYVASSGNVMVPILQDITLTLQEARNISGKGSLESMSSYNLQQFKQGTLQYW